MTHDERYCTNCQDYHLRLSGNGVTKACGETLDYPAGPACPP